MLIDNSISAVFQRDKKVFIPDFGALIFSEFNNEIDFNTHLNFDDGKILAEIQRQEAVSDEEARGLLEDYIEQVKANLAQNGTHYIGGIGYINKGDDDSYTISSSISEELLIEPKSADVEEKEEKEEKKEPAKPTKARKKPTARKPRQPRKKKEAAAVVDQVEKLESPNSENNEENEETSKVSKEEEIPLATITEEPDVVKEEESVLPDPQTEDQDANPGKDHEIESETKVEDEVKEEDEDSKDELSDPFTFQDEQESETFQSIEDDSFSSDEDDYFQQFDENSESKGKNRKPLWIAIAAVVVLIIIAVPLYLFVFHADQGDAMAKVSSENDVSLVKEIKEPVNEEVADQLQSSIEESTTANEDVNETQAGTKTETAVSSSSQVSQVSSNAGMGNEKLYSLILGSFKVESNADNFEQYLNEKGIHATKFQRENAFHFVGIEEIRGKSNAIELLGTLREEEEPTAWIIKKL